MAFSLTNIRHKITNTLPASIGFRHLRGESDVLKRGEHSKSELQVTAASVEDSVLNCSNEITGEQRVESSTLDDFELVDSLLDEDNKESVPTKRNYDSSGIEETDKIQVPDVLNEYCVLDDLTEQFVTPSSSHRDGSNASTAKQVSVWTYVSGAAKYISSGVLFCARTSYAAAKYGTKGIYRTAKNFRLIQLKSLFSLILLSRMLYSIQIFRIGTARYNPIRTIVLPIFLAPFSHFHPIVSLLTFLIPIVPTLRTQVSISRIFFRFIRLVAAVVVKLLSATLRLIFHPQRYRYVISSPTLEQVSAPYRIPAISPYSTESSFPIISSKQNAEEVSDTPAVNQPILLFTEDPANASGITPDDHLVLPSAESTVPVCDIPRDSQTTLLFTQSTAPAVNVYPDNQAMFLPSAESATLEVDVHVNNQIILPSTESATLELDVNLNNQGILPSTESATLEVDINLNNQAILPSAEPTAPALETHQLMLSSTEPVVPASVVFPDNQAILPSAEFLNANTSDIISLDDQSIQPSTEAAALSSGMPPDSLVMLPSAEPTTPALDNVLSEEKSIISIAEYTEDALYIPPRRQLVVLTSTDSTASALDVPPDNQKIIPLAGSTTIA